MGLETPVLFIVFNRPDTTQQVFSAIRKAQPKQLFVAADGPRKDVAGEPEKCQQTRDIVEQVDWDCEVKTLFQEQNLGCGLGPATAITWFFDNIEEGIILEDDCLPHPDFFPFCEQLLDYYRSNERIMHISGDNFQYGRKRGNASYYFSIYTHTWGWATWRRAWKHYDFYLTSVEHRKHAWDMQWMISVGNNNGLAVLPNVNLVSNIGFGLDGTHTTDVARYANLPTESLVFPLVHPKVISPNKAADRYTRYTHFGGETTRAGIVRRRTVDLIKGFIPDKAKRAIGSAMRYVGQRKNRIYLQNIYKKYENFSMIPQSTFIGNLELCQRFSSTEGCIVECGVWRGGMIASMADLLDTERSYYLFDSFEGMPPVQEIDGDAAKAWQEDTTSSLYFDNCRAGTEFAEEAMQLSGAKHYQLIKGWFSETLPNFEPDMPIAILRLDGDWYDSTMQCLNSLYKYVAEGGLIIIDDYHKWDGCAKAVHDFLSTNKLPHRICQSNSGVCYIVKKSV